MGKKELLAVERTHLANERTMLAFIRTAMAFFGTGLVLVKIWDTDYSYAIAGGSFVLSAYLFGIGIINYFHKRRKIEQI